LYCRCQDKMGRHCHRRALSNSIFCETHQRCRGSPLSGAEPPFAPERFNRNPLIQDVHNCWDYGMNVIDPTQLNQCKGKIGCEPRFHQPGGTKGLSKALLEAKGRTCKSVDYLMRQDVPDIDRSTFKAQCPSDKSKIALVVHPGEDYHFYGRMPMAGGATRTARTRSSDSMRRASRSGIRKQPRGIIVPEALFSIIRISADSIARRGGKRSGWRVR